MGKFICRNPEAEYSQDRIWEGRIDSLQHRRGMIEADISGKGSQMHVIIGEYAYGNFVCIPEWGVGSPLSYLDDRFWNRERLAQYMGNVDAITLSEALKEIKNIRTE